MWEQKRKKAAQQAEVLVDRMTVEEMISQLRFNAPEIRRLGVPAYNWWNEALHGVARAGTATVFPQAIGMAASWNQELLHEIGNAVAEEGRAKYNAARKQNDRDIYKGLTFWAPNVNIFRDPRWGRGQETYGEDPLLTSELAVSYVTGLQGNGEYMKAAACAKHFAVHSGPEALRHSFNAVASEKDMRETYLPAFEACVKRGEVEAVMGAYNRTNGEACCASHRLIREILRDEWGFQGHFVSDCWALKDIHEKHRLTKTPEESAALALKSGCDLNCGCTYLTLKEAYEKHMVSKKEIRAAAIRLFTCRYLLGMFEDTPYDEIGLECVESEAHLALARQAAAESIVLLKNNGILPIQQEKARRIAVIGPNAADPASLIGNYHGTASRYVTAMEGIREAAPEGVRLFYAQGCHKWKRKTENLAYYDDRIPEAVAAAQESDLVILCLGLDESLEGEEGDTGNAYASGDKQDLKLPESQYRLMHAVFETGTPVIVCMFSGSAVDLTEANEKAAAIFQVWYPGAQGGAGLADLLFGRQSPSGKLPVTFYRDLEGFPEFTDYSMKGRTYRYLEKEPLYPFGYGLSYGRMQIRELKLKEIKADHIIFECKIENEGRKCKDVLQLYVRQEGSELAPRNGSLAGFRKIELEQGASCTVELEVRKEAFMAYDSQGEAVWDADSYLISAGFHAPDVRSCTLDGRENRELNINVKAIRG